MKSWKFLSLSLMIMFLLSSLLIPLNTSGDGISGRTVASNGLLQSGSFTAVEVFDIDDDGQDEIFLGGAGRTNPKTQGIRAYTFNTGNSTWTKIGSGLPGSSSGDYYGALGVGDVNKDGNMDIAAPSQTKWYSTSENKVEIFTSNSQGVFSLSHTFSPGKSTSEAEIVDMDGDSNMDIVYTYDGGVTVQFGSGSATSWTESNPSASGREMDGIGVGDLNGDGLLDIIATTYSGSNFYIYIQGSSRSWTQQTKSIGSVSFGAKISDLNGDGYNDIVVGSRSNGMKVWCGNGGGSIGGTSFIWTDNSSGLPSSGGDWNQIELGDIDEDGDLDLVSTKNSESRVRVYLNNQPNSWTELLPSSPFNLGTGADGYGANFGDWDGDGHLDVVGCSWGGGVDAWTMDWAETPPPPVNKLPVPDAGEDQEIMLGEMVSLDGTGSTDPEDAPTGDTAGTELEYDWNVTSYPSGSLIRDGSLSPSDSDPEPSFTPDKVGTYVISLSVKDSDDEWSNLSDEDEVIITVLKPNDPPVADAGPDASGLLGEEIDLDGFDSYDPDGSIAYYEWTCTSHSVSIDGQGTYAVSFTPMQAGVYNFQLRVRDDNDTWSSLDYVNVTIVNPGQNVPPIADAGPNQEVMLGDLVTLDGTGSMDTDGEIVTWEWTCTSHTIELSSPNSSAPSFTPSEPGTYLLSLRVKDDNNSWSSLDIVEVFVEEPYFNNRPVADAGEDIDAYVGDLVELDGRGSYDVNGLVAEYNWTCTSHEIGLLEAMSSTPSFVPESAGTYVFTLAVSDDEGAWSTEDEVTVSVSERPEDPLFDVELGPFLYDNDSPIIGAQVVMIIDDTEITKNTDVNGMADFEDLEAGSYQVAVKSEGVIIISYFEVLIVDDGIVSYPDGLEKADVPVVIDDDDDDDDLPPPPDDDDGGGSVGLIIGIILILFLLTIGGAALFLFMRRSGEDDDGGDDEEEDGCPHCGAPMHHDDDFGRDKCTKCGRFS